MKAARLAVLGVALGAGVLAYSMMSGQPEVVVTEAAPRMDTVDVLVASSDISLGKLVTSNDVRWQAFPKETVSSGYITNQNTPDAIAEISGSISRMQMLAGEPINMRKVVKADRGGFMSAILEPGMRAVAIQISAESSAGGFILPNDRVDVLLTRSGQTSSQEFVTETILRNVRVLAIDQTVQDKDGGETVIGETATLELSPNQSEVISLAARVGGVTLVLRPLAEGLGDDEQIQKPEEDKRLTLMRYGISRDTSGVQ
jgi:pilus assembly protein CpaB